jgi:hypothetical protein
VSKDLDDPEDGKTDLIAPNAHQLPLYGTSSTSPAMTSGAVCDLVKASRRNKPFKETDGTQASATVEEQQRCLNLCIALLDQKLHGKLTESIMVYSRRRTRWVRDRCSDNAGGDAHTMVAGISFVGGAVEHGWYFGFFEPPISISYLRSYLS